MIYDGSAIRWDVHDELRYRLLDYELQGRRAMTIKMLSEKQLMNKAGRRGRDQKRFAAL